jgi:hypothetical protein
MEWAQSVAVQEGQVATSPNPGTKPEINVPSLSETTESSIPN